MKTVTAEQKAREVNKRVITQNEEFYKLEDQLCILVECLENYETYVIEQVKIYVSDFEEFITEKEKLQELIENLKRVMLEESKLKHTHVNAYKVAEVLKILNVKKEKEIDPKISFFLTFSMEEATQTFSSEDTIQIVSLLDK